MGQTPPGRLQPVIGNLLLTLDSISFHTQFQFHCDKQLKRIQIIMCYHNPYPTTPSSDTSPQEFTHEECKMPGAAPGDPGGARQRCSTTETPQQTQQLLCNKLLNHDARLVMPALIQDTHYPISRLEFCAGCGCTRT